MTPRSIIRQSLRLMLAVLLSCGLILVLHYFLFWRPYAARMRKQATSYDRLAASKTVDVELLKRVGSFLNDKSSSFTRFPEQKAAGTMRVCAFGDSLTYGQETSSDHDYPSLLQRQFDAAGRGHVEVLNFGSPWHGFAQAFLVWEHFQRRFGCDDVLLGPGTFFPLRDTTFNHSAMLAPAYLHARYVLDGDDVRLVEVPGDWSGDARLDEYLRFFPRWEYLRYDRNPPPVLLAALASDRTVSNPFYYRTEPVEQEALGIYRVLLRKMARGSAKVILLHADPSLLDAATRLFQLNLTVVAEGQDLGFPYRAPEGHRSAWGNDLVARQFHAQIARPRDARLTILHSEDLPVSSATLAEGEPEPIFEHEDVKIMLGDRPAGIFTTTEPSGRRAPAEQTTLQAAKVTALLALEGADTSLVDACYLPVDFDLRPGARVELLAGPESAPRQVQVSTVRAIGDASTNVALASLVGLRCRCSGPLLCERTAKDPEAIEEGSALLLRVDGKPVMRGTASGKELVLEPTASALRGIRADRESYADVDSLAPSGTFDLVFEERDGRTRRVPLVSWTKTTRPIALQR